MVQVSREVLFERIRRARREQGLSGRGPAARYKVSRRTVRQAPESPVPFTLCLSYSGRAIHRACTTASQEAFLEGHPEAFTVLGGVPSVHIRYDNLRPAVKQLLFGRSRLGGARLCAAIVDRITFRCILIQTGTESYRLQATEGEHRVKTHR